MTIEELMKEMTAASVSSDTSRDATRNDAETALAAKRNDAETALAVAGLKLTLVGLPTEPELRHQVVSALLVGVIGSTLANSKLVRELKTKLEALERRVVQ